MDGKATLAPAGAMTPDDWAWLEQAARVYTVPCASGGATADDQGARCRRIIISTIGALRQRLANLAAVQEQVLAEVSATLQQDPPLEITDITLAVRTLLRRAEGGV